MTLGSTISTLLQSEWPCLELCTILCLLSYKAVLALPLSILKMVLYFIEFMICQWHVLLQKCRMHSFFLYSDLLGHLGPKVALLMSSTFR